MICRCGRLLILINEASDTPKCRGCGLVSELCPCAALELVLT